VFDTVYNEVSTDEDFGVYEERCKEWVDVIAKRCGHHYFQQPCTDEPATMLDNVADKDGKAAWNKFLARWSSVSISTTMAGLEQLLDYHPKNASMAQHVTGWEDLTRKLKEWKVALGELPALESMLFLQTLPAKYNDLINHKKLQADELKDVPKLYASAVGAWSASVDRDSDEANTSGKAMWLDGGGGGSSDGNPDGPGG
jgi:hypothetical protein